MIQYCQYYVYHYQYMTTLNHMSVLSALYAVTEYVALHIGKSWNIRSFEKRSFRKQKASICQITISFGKHLIFLKTVRKFSIIEVIENSHSIEF